MASGLSSKRDNHSKSKGKAMDGHSKKSDQGDCTDHSDKSNKSDRPTNSPKEKSVIPLSSSRVANRTCSTNLSLKLKLLSESNQDRLSKHAHALRADPPFELETFLLGSRIVLRHPW